MELLLSLKGLNPSSHPTLPTLLGCTAELNSTQTHSHLFTTQVPVLTSLLICTVAAINVLPSKDAGDVKHIHITRLLTPL